MKAVEPSNKGLNAIKSILRSEKTAFTFTNGDTISFNVGSQYTGPFCVYVRESGHGMIEIRVHSSLHFGMGPGIQLADAEEMLNPVQSKPAGTILSIDPETQVLIARTQINSAAVKKNGFNAALVPCMDKLLTLLNAMRNAETDPSYSMPDNPRKIGFTIGKDYRLIPPKKKTRKA